MALFSIKLGKIRFSTIFALLFSSSSSKVSLYSIFDFVIQYKNSLILQNIWFVQPYITMTNTHTKGLNRKNPSIFDHVTPLGP